MESNDKQQIGGYFSTKNASKDEALKGIVAARISASEDVTDNEYTALSNLIRVATSEGCRILLVQETKSRSSRIAPTGMLLPAGTVEYFSVTPGSKVSVTGTANISSIEQDMGMNYSTILASLLDGISLALKSGNSNVDAEQFNFLTDAINKSTIIPSYFDRENAIKYLDVSDTEFARLTQGYSVNVSKK